MSVFDWCATGDHVNCRRTFRRFVLDPKSKRVIWLDEHVSCECAKRGCKCYVPKKERKK